MSKKSKDDEKKDKKKDREGLVKEETRHTVLGIIFFVLAVFLVLAPLALAGIAGEALYKSLQQIVGIGFFIFPLIFIFLGITFIRKNTPSVALRVVVGSLLFAFSGLGLLHIAQESGGLLGRVFATPFLKFFDVYMGILFLGALFIISLLIMFDARPDFSNFSFLKSLELPWKKKKEFSDTPSVSTLDDSKDEKGEKNPEKEKENKTPEDTEVDEPESTKEERKKPGILASLTKKKTEEELFDEGLDERKKHLPIRDFVPPPLTLLENMTGKPLVGDVKANTNIIKRTLQNFGVTVEMDEVSIGPTVTRYSLKPAEGVKLSRIVGLQNELSLALAAHPVRVEAPIPGTSLVGIEVPNKTKAMVGLASLLKSKEFKEVPSPLLISLGKSISGKNSFGNLAKMPHLLIAGATGSGKSVMVHSMITSLLYRNPPENMRLLLIDPKRVELTLYNGIPHLLSPVITNAKLAIQALRWAGKEMSRRYDVLEAEAVRDIESYHKNVIGEWEEYAQEVGHENESDASRPEKMPYIVIVIDELADIMQSHPRELESAIVRLAQMSRAVGIHLVLSTQRPSVNVITGLIKANIPARIALQVASQIDSRTILDMAGAEKLLGAGDMLYLSGEMSRPIRLQSPYISENEVKKVAKHLARQYENELPDEIELRDIPDKNSLFEATLDDDDPDKKEDPLYEQAKAAVIEAKKASTSYLQRKLSIGYGRAARLVDSLEENGIVGPADGSKSREILVGAESEEESDSETEDGEEKHEKTQK